MRGGRDAQRGVDRRDRARIHVGIVERDLVAERRLRTRGAIRHRVRVTTRADERRVLELLGVCERALLVELAEPGLEPITKRPERIRIEPRVERLDIGVDRQDLDAVGAQEPGEHRHREIGSGGVPPWHGWRAMRFERGCSRGWSTPRSGSRSPRVCSARGRLWWRTERAASRGDGPELTRQAVRPRRPHWLRTP